MIIRFLVALVALSFCSTSVLANDVFVSFDQNTDVPASTVPLSNGSGSAFILSRNGFNFDAFELDVTNSNTGVIQITNAQIFNSQLGTPPLVANRFDIAAPAPAIPATPTTPAVPATQGSPIATSTAGSANLFATAIGAQGVQSSFATIDPNFRSNFNGGTGAFLIAQIDYNIVGVGTTVLNLTEGSLGFFSDESPDELLVTNFESGTLTVVESTAIPEPSSAVLLALGVAGLVARRRR